MQVKGLNDESSSKNSRAASKVSVGCCDDHDNGESQINHDHTHHNHNHNHNNNERHNNSNKNESNQNETKNNDDNNCDHSHHDNNHVDKGHNHNHIHNHNHDDNCRDDSHSHNIHDDSHDHNHISSNHHDKKSNNSCDHNHDSHDDCNTRSEVQNRKIDTQIDHKNDILDNTKKAPIENENENENESAIKENNANITEKTRNPDPGSVCLHYDKDEELASNFGVGIFPQLSTVTYLSRTKDTAPTVILERYPKDPVAQSIHKCYVSYPVRGKHVRFDGLYLHGACPQFCDSENIDDEFNTENMNEEDIDVVESGTKNDEIDISTLSLNMNKNENTVIKNKILENRKKKFRVTFLVNIWINHKPLKVENLSNEICEKLIKKEKKMIINNDMINDIIITNNDECRTKICTLNINEKIATDGDNGTWVDIPFITDDSDWGKDNSETDLFLRIWAPSENFFQKNIKKMINSKFLKNKKKDSENENKKKLYNINRSKIKVGSGVEESEEAVTTFEINYLHEDCYAFFLYDDDDISEDGDEDSDSDSDEE